MDWTHRPAKCETSCPITYTWDYIISHRDRRFLVSHRDSGKEIGETEFLDAAKSLAESHKRKT